MERQPASTRAAARTPPRQPAGRRRAVLLPPNRIEHHRKGLLRLAAALAAGTHIARSPVYVTSAAACSKFFGRISRSRAAGFLSVIAACAGIRQIALRASEPRSVLIP